MPMTAELLLLIKIVFEKGHIITIMCDMPLFGDLEYKKLQIVKKIEN